MRCSLQKELKKICLVSSRVKELERKWKGCEVRIRWIFCRQLNMSVISIVKLENILGNLDLNFNLELNYEAENKIETRWDMVSDELC